MKKIDKRSKEEEKHYNNIHQWLRNNHGKAYKCDNIDCMSSSQNYEWAKLKGKEYEKDVNNFHMLCKSCHTIYDFTDDTRNKMMNRIPWNKGKSGYLSKESKRKMGLSIARKCIDLSTGKIYETLRDACNDTNLSYSTTHKKLNGHCNNTESKIKYYEN